MRLDSPFCRGTPMTISAFKATVLATAILLPLPTLAARPNLAPETMKFVAVDSPLIAIINVKVVDGTGAPARGGQTLVINDGVIAALGPAATTQVPPGAHVIDGQG